MLLLVQLYLNSVSLCPAGGGEDDGEEEEDCTGTIRPGHLL